MRLLSFYYSAGIPADATRVYDLRRYPSPSADLRSRYDGRGRRLQRELLSQSIYQELLASVREVWSGQEDVVIAFGCAEGRHRSAAVVEALGRMLGASVEHRDMDRRQRQRAVDRERREQRQARYAVPSEE
jgi:UPF0042 nucleotide-binding protein